MSILDDVKLDLGIAPEYDAFDASLERQINSAFSRLTQLGVGPPQGFKIQGTATNWDAILVDDKFEDVKTYVFLKVRLVFDPPGTSFAIQAIKEQLKELEWTINVKREDDEWTQPAPR